MDELTAVLVAGFGRSGSTALMSLLGSSPCVAFDRVYPFEHRYLTYLSKLALLLEAQDAKARVAPHQLYDFADNTFGSYPWGPDSANGDGSVACASAFSGAQWLRNLWQAFGAQAARSAPEAIFYAEKAPHWLSPLVHEFIQAYTIYLFRDPRDIYLSANAFMRKRGSIGFDRSAADTDLDYARTVAHRFLSYFENYLTDRQQRDCMMVKYEEMVLDENELPLRLKSALNIETHWGGSPWLGAHRTTLDLHSSAGRWTREALPVEADRFLREYLHGAMVHLGYQLDGSPSARLPPAVEFRLGGFDPACVRCSPGGHFLVQGDATAVVISTSDFWLTLPLPAFEAATVREIWVCMRGAVGDVCSAYWRRGTEDFSEERSMHVPYRGGFHWQIVRIPVGKHPLWKGEIVELRLDPFNRKEGSPDTPQTGFMRWLRLVE